MASRATIEFNYQKARQQASQLEEIAAKLDRLAVQQFAGTMQNVSGSWKGSNADAYLKKGAILQSDIQKSASSLYREAGNIRRIAKRIYDAEMAALAIAQKRTYT